LLNTATVIMMPSRTEALPMVALQAAQMARPVVGTRVGGVPEIIVHQQTGLVVDQENPRALAAAIRFLFNHPESAVRMGQSARHRLQKHFSWKRHVDAYDRLYRKLLRADAASASAENL
jgi:glycogen synthase